MKMLQGLSLMEKNQHNTVPSPPQNKPQNPKHSES